MIDGGHCDSEPPDHAPCLDRPRGRLPRPVHGRARFDDRQRCPARHPGVAALQPGRPHVGRQRLSRHVRQLHARRRSLRRPRRSPPRVPVGRRAVHARLRRVRPVQQSGAADRRPLRPGDRRRGRLLGHDRADRQRVPGCGRSREGDERLHVRGRRRWVGWAAARWADDRVAELALDLLHQPADRDRDAAARPRLHRRERGARDARRGRHRRRGARDSRADARRLRDHRLGRPRLGLGAHARLGRRLDRAARSVLRRSSRGSRTRSCRSSSCVCRAWRARPSCAGS